MTERRRSEVPYRSLGFIPAERDCDISVQDDGSIVVFYGVSEEGREWLDLNLEDGPRWAGGHAVEGRYANAILVGAAEAGLEVEER